MALAAPTGFRFGRARFAPKYASASAAALVLAGKNPTLSQSGGSASFGRVFFDGFESGSPNALWRLHSYLEPAATVVTTAVDGGSAAHTGTHSLMCNWIGGGSNGVALDDPGGGHGFPAFTSEFLLRYWFRYDDNVEATDGAKHFRLGTGGAITDNQLIIAGVRTKELFIEFEAIAGTVGGQGQTSAGGASSPGWHKVEIYIKQHATQGIGRVWVDDVLKLEVTNKNMTYSAGWGSFNILSNWTENTGWEHPGDNNFYLDDVEIYTDQGTGGTGSMSDGTAGV